MISLYQLLNRSAKGQSCGSGFGFYWIRIILADPDPQRNRHPGPADPDPDSYPSAANKSPKEGSGFPDWPETEMP
jgi:hypothetical protein